MAHLALLPLVLWVATLLLLLLKYLLRNSNESEDMTGRSITHHPRGYNLKASDAPPPLLDILADMLGYRPENRDEQDKGNDCETRRDSMKETLMNDDRKLRVTSGHRSQYYSSTQKIAFRYRDHTISSTLKNRQCLIKSKSLDDGQTRSCLNSKRSMSLSLDGPSVSSNVYHYYFASEMSSTIVGGINFRV